MMVDPVLSFYDALAAQYHLLFEDWERSVERQANVLAPILASYFSEKHLKILDCSCGIGTQALGFAGMGHTVVASDRSLAAVDRARREAESRGLNVTFHVSDMTSLAEIVDSDFHVVATLDNALPHLDAGRLKQALCAIASKLKPGGLFLASIRDYQPLKDARPSIQPPAFYDEQGSRRIVHQVWDWIDDDRYIVHLYLTVHTNHHWTTSHFVSEYRCLLREELSSALVSAGFYAVRWLTPAESDFHQPIVLARRYTERPVGYSG